MSPENLKTPVDFLMYFRAIGETNWSKINKNIHATGFPAVNFRQSRHVLKCTLCSWNICCDRLAYC